MTEAEIQTIKDGIDKAENLLFDVYLKENRMITFDDIRTAMDSIKHTLEVELANGE